MANRTGQNYSVPKLGRNTGVQTATPVVRYATTPGVAPNAGTQAFALGDVLKQISSRIEDRLDIQADVEGLRDGAIAGAGENLPQLKDETTIRGRAFNRSARDAVAVRVDLQGRETLNDYEQKNLNNPTGFRRAADAYLQGQLPALQAFDPSLAQRYEAEYKLRADSIETRVMDRHREIVRDRQLETSLRHQLALQDEIASDAATLFSADAATARKTMERMISNAGSLIDNANQIGPDGRPLYSARERVAAERQAEEMVAEQVGVAWMRRQPDALAGFKAWRDGTAEIELQADDGTKTKVNLKEMLGNRGYQVAGEKFMETLRSELSLQNQIEATNDRAFKQSSDQLYADLSVAAQSGRLTLNMVEASRAQLEPDRYVALTALARGGGASVSDGATMTQLSIDDANGQDIRPQLRQAFGDGKIASADFIELYNRNTQRIDQGTKDPVQTGRDYLTQSLGVLSREVGLAQSAGIGQADAEYQIEVQAFMDKNKRQPTHIEARDIAERIRGRYSILGVEESLLSMPLPQSMTQAEKMSKSLNTVLIEKKIADTNAEYLKIHNGNAALRDADPAYLREVRLLKDYYDLLRMKENENGNAAGAK